MKVSLSWLGVFLILAFLIYFIVYGSHVYETFQNKDIHESFTSASASASDLKITKCPASSVSYINNKGITLCCDGIIVNGTCSGTTMCSLSESTSTAPTCSEWMEAYLDEKAVERCPRSMPNYFESEDGSMVGCTSGKRTKDGSGPLVTSSAEPGKEASSCNTNNLTFCRIYPDKVSDEGKLDSCSNQKLLESTMCFNNKGSAYKTLVANANEAAPATVQCSYKDSSSNIYTCSTNSSMERYQSAVLPSGTTLGSWKSGSAEWDPLYKLKFCSILEQYEINKTLSFADLESVKVYN